MSGIRLLALDGNDTVGGTKYLVHYDDSGVMLDFGANFAKLSRYYEEYLKPRSTTGILDLVTMGVLPDARGLYRDDIVLPETNLRGPEVGSIEAVLLTHSHLDHAGAVGLLRPEIPVVMGALTAATLKAIQDSGKSELGRESVYASVRKTEVKRGSPILKSTENALGRDVRIAEGSWPREFEEFWTTLPAQTDRSRKKYDPGDLLAADPTVNFRSTPVDHSVKDSRGYVVDTPQGRVVYPGDVRSHGSAADRTTAFVDMARSPRPYILFMEGTNAGSTTEKVATEADVRRNVKALLASMTGKFVIADFGPRNIERLEIFLEAARECSRQLVVTTKDAYLLHAMHTVDPDIPLPGQDIVIYDSPKGQEGSWESWILDLYSRTTAKPPSIHEAPGDFVVAFSFFDIKHLVDLRPEGGHYIYSSSEAYTEDQEIDFRRLNEWLVKFHIQRHGFDFDTNGRPIFPGGPDGLHASGHAPASELLRIVRAINPEVVVPLHTERPGWFVETLGSEYRVILPRLCEWVEI